MVTFRARMSWMIIVTGERRKVGAVRGGRRPVWRSGGEGRGTGLPPRRSKAMRRVVVTGLGVVAPNGVGKEDFWSACVHGRSGVGPIRTFDASAHPVGIAAEVPDFDMSAYVTGTHRKSLK